MGLGKACRYRPVMVIMAAVAFAGLLVAIMRSSEIRAMLVDLVENALGAAG